jgi:hypothetical protein
VRLRNQQSAIIRTKVHGRVKRPTIAVAPLAGAFAPSWHFFRLHVQPKLVCWDNL